MVELVPDWQRRPLMRAGHHIIKKLERSIVRADPNADQPFYDCDDYPWIARLESSWQTILGELQQVMKYQDQLPNFQDISQDQVSITQDQLWKTFFLYGYGYKAEDNCRRCPQTTQLLETVPNMLTAFFSILAPGKHIPPHRGPYKGILRFHLALIVPEPVGKCRIRVGDEIRFWEQGKSLLFDDTFEHEVWNDTPGTRVVLFVDVIRPLPFPSSLVNKLVVNLIRWSPFVQNARKNVNDYTLGVERTTQNH
jgi:beta-hydroxylase